MRIQSWGISHELSIVARISVTMVSFAIRRPLTLDEWTPRMRKKSPLPRKTRSCWNYARSRRSARNGTTYRTVSAPVSRSNADSRSNAACRAAVVFLSDTSESETAAKYHSIFCKFKFGGTASRNRFVRRWNRFALSLDWFPRVSNYFQETNPLLLRNIAQSARYALQKKKSHEDTLNINSCRDQQKSEQEKKRFKSMKFEFHIVTLALESIIRYEKPRSIEIKKNKLFRRHLTSCIGNWFTDHNEWPNRIQ